jgi:hypothetical protein
MAESARVVLPALRHSKRAEEQGRADHAGLGVNEQLFGGV